jgi:drug/metabolite transporter superfamily protein YnfA
LASLRAPSDIDLALPGKGTWNMNNNVMGCLSPQTWWADQRAKRRTVVLVIVLAFYGWLTTALRLTALEAAGLLLTIGLAAGVVLDRVVDGTRSSAADLAVLLRLADGLGRL